MSEIITAIFCETKRSHLLDGYLDFILSLQPTAFHLRMFVPLFMIQLGEDDRAYNFIKFWVKITSFQVRLLKASWCKKWPKIVPDRLLVWGIRSF